MGIIFVKGTNRHGAWFKSEPLVKAGGTQDKDGAFPDLILPQGKAEQFRADPLLLKLGLDRQRRQMQPANRGAVIGPRKSNRGDDRIGMNAHPLMQRLVVFVEIFNELCFMNAVGEGLPQQGRDLGMIFSREFAYFHFFSFPFFVKLPLKFFVMRQARKIKLSNGSARRGV